MISNQWTHYMLRRAILVSFALGLLPSLTWAAAPTSRPSDDAWPLYARAIQRVAEGDRANIMSPAASPLDYPEYPPYSAEWHRLESASYAFNAPARALVHEARSRNSATLPSALNADGTITDRSLFDCRSLANELGDAALEQHLQGDDASAIESLRDLLHLCDLLERPAPSSIVQALLTHGIRMLAVNRLEIITAEVSLTDDRSDPKPLQIATAKELIRRLFDLKDPAPHYADLLNRGDFPDGPLTPDEKSRFQVQMRRGQMECNLASMSLACHLFRHDKHRWPASIEEFTAYLPAPPRDAWGQMGYVLLKPEHPGAAERPVVYSQCDSKSGLFYPTSEPHYSWYPGFHAGNTLKHGGQFRDVSLWAPAHPNPEPTTQPLR
jgi:hypothetical protein